MPSTSSKKGLKEGECVASSSSCVQRLQLPTGGTTTPIDSILPNLPQTDQDQDSAKNLIIDEILGAELFGSNSNTNSATQSSSLPQTTISNPAKRDDSQGKKKALKERVLKSWHSRYEDKRIIRAQFILCFDCRSFSFHFYDVRD